MKEFFARLVRMVAQILKRFASDHPANTYEAVIFGAIRDAATIYSRRVII